MAVAYVTGASVNSSSSVTSLSNTSSGISGSNLVGYLVVSSGGVPTNPTWNGVSMGASIATQVSWFGDTLYVYRLANPANGTVSVTGMPSAPHSMVWMVFSGVEQISFNRTAAGTTGYAVNSSVSVTSVADDLVFDVLYIGGTVTATEGTNQTLRASIGTVNGNDGRMYASTEPATTTSTTMSWTHSIANRTLVGLSLIPAVVAPTVTTQPANATAIVTPSTPAVFTAAATASTGNITGITVKKDGVTITTGGVYSIVTSGVGSSPNGTVTITVTPTDTSLNADVFTVDFTDANGTTTTSNATLTVYNGSTITSPTTNGSGIAVAVLTSDVVNGTGSVKLVTVTHNGATIRTTARKTA